MVLDVHCMAFVSKVDLQRVTPQCMRPQPCSIHAGSDDGDDDDSEDEVLPADPYHLPINHEVTLQVCC